MTVELYQTNFVRDFLFCICVTNTYEFCCRRFNGSSVDTKRNTIHNAFAFMKYLPNNVHYRTWSGDT